MRKKYMALVKIGIVLALIGAFVWFLVISPMKTFQEYENEIEEAAKRYYEFHSSELPTGERVNTLSLSTLYKEKNLEGTYYAPISHDACSVEKSWVKVKKDGSDYKYYIYLDCGRMQSKIDHEGPVIKLKGKETMQVNINEEYKEPGVDSVIDSNDGKIDNSTVLIKGEVDTSKTGTYEITYTAYDELKNKTVVKRTVKVVKLLNSYIRQDLGDNEYYKGEPLNNYVLFSNMYFRIVGFTDKQDIMIVAEEDVANVGYNKLSEWLDEVYLKSLTKKAKKLLVKHQFCSSTIKEVNQQTKDCKTKTKATYVFVPSIKDINNAESGEEVDQEELASTNFLRPKSMSWTADNASTSEAYITKRYFFNTYDVFMKEKSTYNYGVRPMLVIKGNVKVKKGNGSKREPYVLEDFSKGRSGELLNKREVGEVIEINGFKWIVIDTLKDGTTKVISYASISNTADNYDEELENEEYYDEEIDDVFEDRVHTPSNPEDKLTFNPKDKKNYAYFINNKASKYIDTSYFVSHDVEAPIYKGRITYKGETKTVKYKLKLSPPNMYDMFSAQLSMRGGKLSHSYWLINSSTSSKRYCGVMSDTGNILNYPIQDFDEFGVRAVAYTKKGTVVTSGDGTYEDPYIIK